MKLFGIKQIMVNDYCVNTFNVSIKQTAFNLKLAENSGLSYLDRYGKKGDKIRFTYTSLNVTDFNNKVQKLGEVLKEVAQNNINVAQANLDNKYYWVK
jgi:hypothetical protein